LYIVQPFIKKLVTVIEMLSNHKQRYMNQWPPWTARASVAFSQIQPTITSWCLLSAVDTSAVPPHSVACWP